MRVMLGLSRNHSETILERSDVLDRPDCQVLQIRHEGLELPGREGWIPIEVLPHGIEGGLADC